jgi:hypothetical protein
MSGFLLLLLFFPGPPGSDLEKARDAQDRPALDRMAAQFNTAAQSKANDAAAQYKLALAESYVAEVAIEVRDKNAAHAAAEAGIDAAKKRSPSKRIPPSITACSARCAARRSPPTCCKA